MSFVLTPKQMQAQEVLSGTATHCMLFGGSRSGKTFLLTRNVVLRAIKAPKSRHAILRFRFNHIKASIVLDTFPKVMATAFPGIDYRIDKTDWYVTFPNGSQIWFGGLDDKERTEKILGQEHATIYLNECSQIPLVSVDMATTRLAQLVYQEVEGMERIPLKPRMYYDCNPPNKLHWTYQRFIEKRDPDTKKTLPNPADYESFQINPQDNESNLSAGYLNTLRGLSARLRARFLDGCFADANPNALFPDEHIDKWRVVDGVVPDMVRVVVAVDPSGADDDSTNADAIGIVVAGIGTDGNAYVLEDCTVTAGPATWGKVAVSAYERHDAHTLVAEKNYGGAMVGQVIKTARTDVNPVFKLITSSQGKVLRAEPFSALYEQGKVRHVGRFDQLEDELGGFTTSGYNGAKSPNRADALVFALAELFPGMVKIKNTRGEELKIPANLMQTIEGGWMA